MAKRQIFVGDRLTTRVPLLLREFRRLGAMLSAFNPWGIGQIQLMATVFPERGLRNPGIHVSHEPDAARTHTGPQHV